MRVRRFFAIRTTITGWWVVFDWDEEGFRNFVSDPEMVEVFEVGGIAGQPQAAEFVREHDV